jgi:hypothetical protein
LNRHRVLLWAIALWAFILGPVQAEQLRIRLLGQPADLLSVSVVEAESGNEYSLLEDGEPQPLDIAGLVGGRPYTVGATLQVEVKRIFLLDERHVLTVPLQFVSCLTVCEDRTIRIPDFDRAFDRGEIRATCGQGGGSGFQQRMETLLFCQAAFRFQAQRGEGGRELSDIALNGWYRAIFELHTFHQTLGVRFVGRDVGLERAIRLRLTSGLYATRVRITPTVYETEITSLDAVGREAIRYVEAALRIYGSSEALRQVVTDTTALYRRTAASPYPPDDNDWTLLATARALAGLPPLDQS